MVINDGVEENWEMEPSPSRKVTKGYIFDDSIIQTMASKCKPQRLRISVKPRHRDNINTT